MKRGNDDEFWRLLFGGVTIAIASIVMLCFMVVVFHHQAKTNYDAELVQLRTALAYYQGGGR